jgi:hypothetical protein
MTRPAPTPTFRWRPALCWIAAVLVVLSLVSPAVLSPVATSAVNRRLATLPGYHAEVGRVRVAVWKLAVEISDFVVRPRDAGSDGPLIKVKHGTITLLPSALIRGKLRIQGSIRDTELLIYNDAPSTDQGPKDVKDDNAGSLTTRAGTWQSQLQERFDVEIDRFEITRTKVRFVDRAMPGSPAVTIADLHLVAQNLKTQPESGEELPAHVEVTARFAGGGTLRGEAALAPMADRPRFKASLEVKDLALVPLHEVIQAYARVDVRKGTFDVFIEAEAQGGHYAGYVKPFFRDLEFKALPDPEKGLIRNSAMKVASAVTNLLKNEDEKVATKAPFEGDFGATEFDIWETIQNLLRNAFIQSLREGFER